MSVTVPGRFALWAWLFVALGLGIAVLGPALPAIREDLHVSLSASGLIFTLHSAGYLSSVLAAGPLSDARGRKLVTGAGAAGLAAGMLLGAVAHAWPLLLGAMVLAGAGFGCIDVGLNAAIGDAVPGTGRRAAAMNLLHGAFPVGTLAAPAGLALAWRVGWGWRAAFAGVAAATAVSLAGFRGRPWSDPPELNPAVGGRRPRMDGAPGQHGLPPAPDAAAGGRRPHLLALLREPYLRNLALMQCLYVGVEVSIAGWIATYLVGGFGASEAAGALATGLYWAGFLVGRPAAAFVTHRWGPARVLPWLSVAGLAASAAGALAPGPAWAVALYALAGLAICGIFPTVMALALEGHPERTGSAAALITAAASVGSLLWPALVGVVAQAAGLRLAMGTAAAPLAVMLVLGFATFGRLPAPPAGSVQAASRASSTPTS